MVRGYRSLGDIAARPDIMGEPRETNADVSGERTKPGTAQPASVRKPRILVTGLPWLTRMSVPFTSVLNQPIIANTKPQDFDVVTLGAWSDLVSARAVLSISGYSRDWSLVPVPVQMFAGNTNKIQPVRWSKRAGILPAQAVIRGSWVNTGTEAAGQVVWFCDRFRKQPRRLLVQESTDQFVFLDLTSTSLQAKSDPIDDPMLLWGAQTNAGSAAALIQLFDEKQTYQWSTEQLPIYAMAGFVGSTSPMVQFPRPYFLDKNSRISALYDAAIASGYLCFVAERLTKWKWVDGNGYDDGPGDTPSEPGPTQPPITGVQPSRDTMARKEYALKWYDYNGVWPEVMSQWRTAYPLEGWWLPTGGPPAGFFDGVVRSWNPRGPMGTRK